ncbi:cell division protein FtsQ/DivIB [Corynebacterium lizhenjunii]|uniref:cell division protein FtsQ/DivIB n=1 Tax=Corynebacterium lizhenjunii TaxID=2709394 RepID=UPI0013EC67F0|nr:FtsQ-type POTRA domain-containing protein [Corynebacterium lizhenjunii]
MSRGAIAATIACVLAVCAAAVGAVYAFPLLKVEEFTYEGLDHVTEEEAQQAAGIVVGDNLMRIDAQQAAAQVAQLPWVHSATVARVLPREVHIRVEERQAVAYVESAEGPRLVDDRGYEFIIDVPPAEAVELVGGDDFADAVEVLAALPEELRAQARSVDVADRFNLVFYLDDDRVVEWGANEDNADKARAFATVLKMEGQRWNISNPELVVSR